jgi:hypothetical protein
MTFHPHGGASSSRWFHTDSWLDFNMRQSGHMRQNNADVYQGITHDYSLTPPKPVLDGEPCYEDHPINFDPSNGYFRDYDVRKAAYWALFAGAFGHTYGHHSIWQMYMPGLNPICGPDRFWYEALDRPAAGHMLYVRRLMESRPMYNRIPDQSLLVDPTDDLTEHVQATRAADGTYAFIYIPTANQTVTITMEQLTGAMHASWYNPRTGEVAGIGQFQSSGIQIFTTPAEGPDWVLVLDDISQNFSVPGSLP